MRADGYWYSGMAHYIVTDAAQQRSTHGSSAPAADQNQLTILLLHQVNEVRSGLTLSDKYPRILKHMYIVHCVDSFI